MQGITLCSAVMAESPEATSVRALSVFTDTRIDSGWFVVANLFAVPNFFVFQRRKREALEIRIKKSA